MLCSPGVDSFTLVTVFGLALVYHCLVVFIAVDCTVFGMLVSSTVCVELVLGTYGVCCIVLGVSVGVVEVLVASELVLGRLVVMRVC